MITRSALILISLGLCSALYVIDPTQELGRYFEGIGAISGGGATSKLFADYPEKERDEILDYLFRPNFGASLQMLKVEIGGDAQSSAGTESSHMHESGEENYNRGYEWWLMKEAKKRNPNIKFLGLPWAFPAWVGAGTDDPYYKVENTALYIVKWILGAKQYHDIDVEYIGIWNERGYTVEYVKTLKKTLLENKLENVKIIFADQSNWDEAVEKLESNPSLADVVDIIGVHYPGAKSTPKSIAYGKPLWSVEDSSTRMNRNIDAGCVARILNQNYVNGYITSTIIWNLIVGYYAGGFRWNRMGLMTADQPWSGYYEINNPIWAAAHTTQFSSIGWVYLKHGAGVGKLENGGSYVTLASDDGKDFTMVIETMAHNQSRCERPGLDPYNVTSQEAEFEVKGKMSKYEKFYVWKSDFKTERFFEKIGPIRLVNNKFKMLLEPNQIYTLTTLTSGMKGFYNTPPKSKPFPASYEDDFENTDIDQEAPLFMQQNGVFEVHWDSAENRTKVNRQVILEKPIDWCPKHVQCNLTITLGGNYAWRNVNVTLDVFMPSVNGSEGTFIGARVAEGGCEACITKGIFFAVYPGNNTYQIYSRSDRKHAISSGLMKYDVKFDTWHNLAMEVEGNNVTTIFDGHKVAKVNIPNERIDNGYVAYGTTTFGVAEFDNFKIQSVPTK